MAIFSHSDAGRAFHKAAVTGPILLPKPKNNIMLPRPTSIWQRDSQPNASGRPGAVQIAIMAMTTKPIYTANAEIVGR
ncbi:hypothetical protein GS397_10970 [Sphingobium yanoikuyae]|uniref:Uncharacterized protein n=1 Tax=Sphingobium yanoikuyae TaxID=13690 RepID=A0A6P1GGA1_SPHYA|nr:hypothetical protein [Sphingobium yanoikuyae]QHD67515.1 hypothetical protein GS397_10970 [Sphingobium yanoikuyae]